MYDNKYSGLCVCHCSGSGGCAFVAVSAAQTVHPEGSACSALPPGQTPTDPFSTSCHRHQPQSYRWDQNVTLDLTSSFNPHAFSDSLICSCLYLCAVIFQCCGVISYTIFSQLTHQPENDEEWLYLLTVYNALGTTESCSVVSHHYPLVVTCRFVCFY